MKKTSWETSWGEKVGKKSGLGKKSESGKKKVWKKKGLEKKGWEGR